MCLGKEIVGEIAKTQKGKSRYFQKFVTGSKQNKPITREKMKGTLFRECSSRKRARRRKRKGREKKET